MTHPIKELIQVDIPHHPPPLGHVIAGGLYRLMGFPLGPKPVRAFGEVLANRRCISSWRTACWMSRSIAVGMPSRHPPPPGSGISTFRTAGAASSAFFIRRVGVLSAASFRFHLTLARHSASARRRGGPLAVQLAVPAIRVRRGDFYPQVIRSSPQRPEQRQSRCYAPCLAHKK